ncbi:hypothetical protein [Tuberibacillus sp. Marseille-P3662]|nr:hypothetical protein [Tuberibacillus sp. Marseille-P3662]
MDLDHLPKSVKKTVRYIKQDASEEKLEDIKQAISYAINQRERRLGNKD